MAKWQSPREQRARETAKLVAQYRPAVQAAVEQLSADWTAVPADAEKQIRGAIRQVFTDAGQSLTGDVSYAAIATLQNEFYKPFVAQWHAQKRAAEKAAEAVVDTNRPVVAQVDGVHRIGEFVILRDSTTHTQRVLVCIGGGKRWDDELGSTESYADLAEPNEVEQATADYQRLAAEVATANTHEATMVDRHHARRDADLHAVRDEGREPTLFEDLFAGTSDE